MSDKTRTRRPFRHVVRAPVVRFMELEASGGIAMLAAAIVALLWANLLGDSYHDVWFRELSLFPGDLAVTLTWEEWVNDGLMAIFFFVVGLEVKRELISGELSDRKAAALPVLAALGGMLVPALIYLMIGGGTESRGWGVPVATDIAFAVGVLTLLSKRVPASLKIFLLTLAVADDIGGIVVIAAFYTDDLSVPWFALAVASFVVVGGLRASGVLSRVAYILVALVAWYAMLRSGVHATIAGVVLGLMTPAEPVKGREVLAAIEERLQPWTSYAIVPLFALANAGVVVGGDALGDAFTSPVAWGIILGLVVGKTVGISLASWIAIRSGLAKLPTGATMHHIVGAAALGGIGFTVALFIANLAFEQPEHLDHAKIAILTASVVAGILGSAWLTLTARRTASPADQ